MKISITWSEFTMVLLVCLFSATPLLAMDNQLNTLFSELLGQHQSDEKLTVAVTPFGCTVEGCPEGAGRMIAEYAVAFLMNQGSYELVERMEFRRVVEELDFFQSDMVSSDIVVRAGKMLGAQVIMSGVIGDALGRRMISARMIETETGRVLASSSVTVSSTQLENFHKDVFSERTQLSASAFRSFLIPGWGQFYNDRPSQGALFTAVCATSAGVLIWSFIDWQNKSGIVSSHRTKLYSNDPLEDARLRSKAVDDRDRARHRSAVIGAVTGGVWLINVANAAILGSREGKRIQEMYFTVNNYGSNFYLSFDF